MKLNAQKQPMQPTGTVTRTEDADVAAADSDNSSQTAASLSSSLSQETFDQAAFLENRGYIVGGKHIESTPEKFKEHATTIEPDLPLTATIPTHHNGGDFIVINFIHGDRENPYNWTLARKYATVCMLCGMTLWIGLATTAYSSGLNDMSSDLHTTVEVSQLGLFSFNFVCAVTPLFCTFFFLLFPGGCFIGAGCRGGPAVSSLASLPAPLLRLSSPHMPFPMTLFPHGLCSVPVWLPWPWAG